MESNADGRAGKAVPAGANRWTMRDVMTFVIFNIVIIMVTMIVKMAEDAVLSPQNTFFVGSWLFPLVSTPFYLVMADRIGKRGVLSGSILLFGILYTFMGGVYCAPVAVVGAVVGELAMWGRASSRIFCSEMRIWSSWVRTTARATWPRWWPSTRSCRGSCSCWRCSPRARRWARLSGRSS